MRTRLHECARAYGKYIFWSPYATDGNTNTVTRSRFPNASGDLLQRNSIHLPTPPPRVCLATIHREYSRSGFVA